jgi:antitoxin ParD1/3/4
VYESPVDLFRLEKFVNDKVASGRYYSGSEVIREGLRLLEEQEQLREVKLTALREEMQKGLASRESIPGKQVFDELRTKAKQWPMTGKQTHSSVL